MTDPGELILIVDDEPDMCWALEHLLNKQGLCHPQSPERPWRP